MKKVSSLLIMAILFGGGILGTGSTFSQAQVYVPGPPPPAPRPVVVVTPWVGTNTPWVFYKGDWFLNGVLYYFFGNKIGWAPYYAYPPTYIVRSTYWYAPRWNNWYKAHPVYWKNFQYRYPYWHSHQVGRVYDQQFYNKYHHGQGAGWHKGYQAGVHNPPPPSGRNHHPEVVTPGRGYNPPAQPGQYQSGPPVSRQPGPGREGQFPRQSPEEVH